MLAVMVATFFLYWESAKSLVELWSDTEKMTFTHGYLIAALSIWMSARRLRFLRESKCEPDLAAAGVLLGGSVIWLITLRSGIELGYVLILPFLIWLAVFAMFGRATARQTALPIAFLYFATPTWDPLVPLLQSLTVRATDILVQLTRIPAYAEGNQIHLQVGTFEVAGGCSGLHFFMVAVALGTFYGELARDTLRTRAILIGIAALLAMVGNWLRVYVIVVAGYLTNMQHYLVRVDHYYFGWAVFAIMMAVFVVIARRFPQAPNENWCARSLVPPQRSSAFRVTFSIMCTTAVPIAALLAPVRAASVLEIAELLPAPNAYWAEIISQHSSFWHPVFLGADRESLLEFRGRNGRLQMFVAVYGAQAQGKELIGYGNSLFDANLESVMSNSSVASRSGVRELILERDGSSAVLWYSYRVGSLQTSSGLRAQLRYGVAAAFGEPPLSEVVAVRSDCIPDCATARALIGNFLDARVWRSLSSER